jgi:hypothetical protein
MNIYDWLVTRETLRRLAFPAHMERRQVNGKQRWVIVTYRGWVFYRGERVA